jgi:uncharacterized protein (TIRG00374 family)
MTHNTNDVQTFSIQRGLLIAFLLGIAAITAFALFGDLRELADGFREFNWWLIGPVVALTVWNFGLRFVKWHVYLRVLDVHLKPALSAWIFLAGFAMLLTPGKVGEVIKAVYVRRFTGAPANRTSAVVAAERATDALAMLVLAAIGATQFRHGRLLLVMLAIGALIGILALQRPDLLKRHLHRAERLPIVGGMLHHAEAFIDASSTMFRPVVLVRATAISVVSWSGECFAFFFVLVGLGIDPSPRLLLVATFILAVSSIAGGASMVPGGLGVADASIAGLLVLMLKDEGITGSIAATATILIRFATLWFAVVLGGLAMVRLQRLGKPVERARQTVQSPLT